jgi:hypothetical protein
MQRNVVLLYKTIVAQAAQHFKLLQDCAFRILRHSCNFKFLSSGQHAYRNHSDEVAAITVNLKLFDQTLLAVSLHWPPHRTGCCIRRALKESRIQDATAPVCSPACDMFIKTQATPLWSARL